MSRIVASFTLVMRVSDLVSRNCQFARDNGACV